MKLKKRSKIALFVVIFVISNVFLCILALNPSLLGNYNIQHEIYCDVDKLPNGNYLVTGFPLGGLPILGSINKNPNQNRIYEISPAGSIVWEHRGLYFPHEVEPIKSGYSNQDALLVANAALYGVDQITYPEGILEWQWRPELINWTEVDPSFTKDHPINNPTGRFAEFIVNDVDFINGTDYGESYDSLLISVKAFSIVVLINYTAEMEERTLGDFYGNATNVYWYVTEPVIYQQHNPDRLPNGNIIVADSGNNRVIIINSSTKEIEWQLTAVAGRKLVGPKDINYIEATNTYLITDSGNNRIIESDETGNALWIFKHKDLVIPFDSELLSNGNILISGGGSGRIYEISRTNQAIVWSFKINAINPSGEYHVNFMQSIYSLNFTFVLMFLLVKLRQIYLEEQDPKKKNKTLVCSVLLVISSIPIYIFAETIMNYLGSIVMNIMMSLFPVVPGFH